MRAEDIALIWGGDTGSDDKLLPYVAYLDENGNIADFFMDGFIYLASSAGFPSGNKPYGEFALYTIKSLPEHGTVSLTTDGRLSFFPEKGFSGTVSFTYTYNNYLGESEPCTVEITVG